MSTRSTNIVHLSPTLQETDMSKPTKTSKMMSAAASDKHSSAADKQVIKDEADAEVAYQTSLRAAAAHAEALSQDEARTESKRLAAAEASRALHRVEEARLKAEQDEPAVVKQTFWQWLGNALGGPL
jgi:hypothetical protein